MAAAIETFEHDREAVRRWVWLGAALHFVLWSIGGSLHLAPPLDVPEQLVWGSEWVLGTQKLPPLSSWLLEIAWQLGGMYGIAMLAAGISCTTYLLVFALGARLMPVAQAGAGALLLAGVYYFSWPVHEFNHGMLQMPLWAAFFLIFHIALERPPGRRALIPWAALGAVFALALLAKYSSALLGAAAGLWLLASAKGRAHILTPGPWLGAAVAALVIAPHVIWLAQADFSPLTYVAKRTNRGSPPLGFAVVQMINHLPALLLLLLAGLFARLPSAFSWRRPAPNDAFLIVMGLAPLGLTVLLALAFGLKLRDTWGAPMFSLSGLLLVRAVSGAANAVRLRRLMRNAVILLSAVPLFYIFFVVYGSQWHRNPLRVNWPMPEIGQEVANACQAPIGGPPAIVAGENFLAGLAVLGIAQNSGGVHRPTVILSANLDTSPWIDLDDAKHGIAFVWRVHRSRVRPPWSVRRLARRLSDTPLAPQFAEIPWPRRKSGRLKMAVACIKLP